MGGLMCCSGAGCAAEPAGPLDVFCEALYPVVLPAVAKHPLPFWLCGECAGATAWYFLSASWALSGRSPEGWSGVKSTVEGPVPPPAPEPAFWFLPAWDLLWGHLSPQYGDLLGPCPHPGHHGVRPVWGCT